VTYKSTSQDSIVTNSLSEAIDLARNFDGLNLDWIPYSYVFESDPTNSEMVLVPSGEFLMGITEDEVEDVLALCHSVFFPGYCERNWFADEVMTENNLQIIDHPFFIDRYEVSRNQYMLCVKAGNCSSARPSDFSTKPDQPITRVSFEDATRYCEWRGMSVPSEKQWEYAARGPESWIYPWGNEFVGLEANYCDSSCLESEWASTLSIFISGNVYHDSYAVTAPVTAFQGGESWVGARNMTGNVLEWTTSVYRVFQYTTSQEPIGESNGSEERILRGSAFNQTWNYLRASNRINRSEISKRDDAGFRCINQIQGISQ